MDDSPQNLPDAPKTQLAPASQNDNDNERQRSRFTQGRT